jgi:hypothetical protein
MRPLWLTAMANGYTGQIPQLLGANFHQHCNFPFSKMLGEFRYKVDFCVGFQVVARPRSRIRAVSTVNRKESCIRAVLEQTKPAFFNPLEKSIAILHAELVAATAPAPVRHKISILLFFLCPS